MTPITAAVALADSVAFVLSGATKIKADDIPVGHSITVYEERAGEDGYDPVKNNGKTVKLIPSQPSYIVEGYGNYKCVASYANAVVGYES